jgi:integrase
MTLRKLSSKTQSGYLRWVERLNGFLKRSPAMATAEDLHRFQLDLVERFLEAAPGLKYKAAMSVAYGAGLRAAEVVALKVEDIDSKRMVIRVEQGKGRKDRYALLSPTLLEVLRAWWREGNARGKMLPHGWLFPGEDPVNPLSAPASSPAATYPWW